MTRGWAPRLLQNRTGKGTKERVAHLADGRSHLPDGIAEDAAITMLLRQPKHTKRQNRGSRYYEDNSFRRLICVQTLMRRFGWEATTSILF